MKLRNYKKRDTDRIKMNDITGGPDRCNIVYCLEEKIPTYNKVRFTYCVNEIGKKVVFCE